MGSAPPTPPAPDPDAPPAGRADHDHEHAAPGPGFEPALRAAVRGEVRFDPVARGLYATDASHYQVTPACVVVPVDEADCVAAMKVAHEHGVAITPRGAATALSGQTFGPGMVIDISKHLDRVLEVHVDRDPDTGRAVGGWARVQPGVVRDRLNDQLAKEGLHFAPDPATGSRATVAGMVGNNSSGTRSIIYGKTSDHTLACRFALADGTVLEATPMDRAAWDRRAAGDPPGVSDREARLYRGVAQLIDQHADQIRRRYPKVMRRVAGYNLDAFVEGAGYEGPIGDYPPLVAGRFADTDPPHPRLWDLTQLLVGSEGTLGLLLECTLRLVPLPGATAVCVVHFEDDLEALRQVPAINAHHPSAVELLDRRVLREARVNPATRAMAHWIQGDPAAVLQVELQGDNADHAAQRARDFAAAMADRGVGYAHPVMLEAASQRDVWETRKLGLGLISNVRGPVKGQAFVEDACVPVEHLADYIEKLQLKCRAVGLDTTSYAHASVGVIHFRPSIDLHRPEHRAKMREVAEFAYEEVKKLGGAFSGEHGDGLVRGMFLPDFFGPEVYQAHRQLKALFDPRGLMNPGNIIDVPAMTDPELLRYGNRYRIAEVPALFNYRDQAPPPPPEGALPDSPGADLPGAGFRAAVEQCNGVGACRKVGAGTMCPSYMATRDEADTTRGRANALRLAMSGQLPPEDLQQHRGHTDPPGKTKTDAADALASDGVHEVLELCLSCKACKSECPNAVDMSRLKADALQMRHDRRGVPLGYRFIGRMPDIAPRMKGLAARLAAAVNRVGPYRALFEKLTGIDRRRPLPPFAPRHLPQLLKQRRKAARETSGARGHVVLFNDTYTQTMEPRLGLAAFDLLEGCGYRVTLADAGCCQRPRMSKGLVREAKRLGTKTLENLDRFAQQGLPILCLEPSCASALRDDLPDLVDDVELGRRVAEQVQMIDVFLEQQGVELACDHAQVLLHGHCHQKALFGTDAIRRLFAGMPGTTCREVDSGCCGMAGSFGYEHHELSQTIGEDRLFPAVRDAVARGQTVVACGISCRHQLHDFLGVQAKHWVEVVRPRD